MRNFWDFLTSAKLAIVLFFLLALISILGTIIPQAQPEDLYLMKYGQGLGKLILFLQLHDAYHSWWYIATLFLFLANLVACSLKRWPFSYKLFKRKPWEVNPLNLPNKITLEINGSLDEIRGYLKNILKFRASPEPLNEGELFYKSQNRFSFFSVYVVHLSLVIIIVGALVGALWGWRGSMNILEGDQSNIIQPFRKKDPIQLDFSVKLNKFILETYPNGMPKEYISNVTIIDKNNQVNTLIKVNQPFKYQDIVFYQASYNIIPEFKIIAQVNGKREELILSPIEPATIGDKITIVLKDYGEAHGFVYLRVWMVNELTSESREGLIISGFPPLKVTFGQEEISLEYEDLAKLNYLTGLQAKKDPGNWIVYFGFILMMVGLFLVYYYDPKTYWVYLKPMENKIFLSLGAYRKRERESLQLKLKEIANQISKARN